jgi:hypothetical protein
MWAYLLTIVGKILLSMPLKMSNWESDVEQQRSSNSDDHSENYKTAFREHLNRSFSYQNYSHHKPLSHTQLSTASLNLLLFFNQLDYL